MNATNKACPEPVSAAEAVTISVITDSVGLSAIKEEWHALFKQARSATPYQAWEWCDAWHRHRGEPLFVLVAWAQGHIVGIFPLARRSYFGLPLRRLVFIGDDASNICDFLAAPGFEKRTLAAFLTYLKTHRESFDLVDLLYIPEGSLLGESIPEQGLFAQRSRCRICLVRPLPATWDALLSEFSQNMRGNLRRRRRQLEREFKSVTIDLATGEEGTAALAQLFAMNRTRWQQRRGSSFFDDPRIERFELEVARTFEEQGWLRCYRLRIDGITRAVLYCLKIGDRIDFCNAAFDLEFAKYSLGIVLLSHAMAEAIQEGAREFLFGRGNATYKYVWKPIERPCYRLVLGHDAPRSRLAFALAQAYTFFEEKNIGYWVHNLSWGHKSVPVRMRDEWQRVKGRIAERWNRDKKESPSASVIATDSRAKKRTGPTDSPRL